MKRRVMIAVLTGALALVPVTSVFARSGDAPRAVGETRDPVVVTAPATRVETAEGRTAVTVRAPSSDVDVDTERRRMRIRVPFFDGVIRW